MIEHFLFFFIFKLFLKGGMDIVDGMLIATIVIDMLLASCTTTIINELREYEEKCT